MQQHEGAFLDLDVRIAVVTFESELRARDYAVDAALPWPVLMDESRTLYHAFGMLHGRWQDIWGLPTWWAYLKELVRGRLPRASDADTSQLGGDVLVDPAGIVRFVHVGSGPADRPAIATLLRARREADPIERP